MKIDNRVRARFDRVVNLGQEVQLSARDLPSGQSSVDKQKGAEWAAAAKSLLTEVFGKEHPYCERFCAHTDGYVGTISAMQGQGVILAAQADYLDGGVIKLRSLIEAEVFDDLLEQAENLLGAGYYVAAAVLAGAVLEDALRKLCKQQEIELPESPKVDRMNSDLAKKGLYNQLTMKEITAKSDLRNKAAHGRSTEFTREHVAAMVPWVRRFVTDHCCS